MDARLLADQRFASPQPVPVAPSLLPPARRPEAGSLTALARSVGNAQLSRVAALAGHEAGCGCSACMPGARLARSRRSAHGAECGCDGCGGARVGRTAATSHTACCGCEDCETGVQLARSAAARSHGAACDCDRCGPRLARAADPAATMAPTHTADVVREGTSGGGRPLEEATRADLEPRFGFDLSPVRVHTDAEAARSADQVMARAYTVGPDVVFGAGEYRPGSEDGRQLLAHEIAHVSQQGVERKPLGALPITTPGDVYETAADAAARGALEDPSPVPDGAPGGPVVARFKAGTTKAKKDNKTGKTVSLGRDADGQIIGQGHAAMTERALDRMGGLSDQEIREARQGNWMRDLSQAITPTTQKAVQALMPILQIFSIKEFGKGFSTAEFGTYDPIEHMDNPAGLRASDVITQTSGKGGAHDIASPNQVDDPYTKGQQATAGDKTKGYAKVDERYKAAIEKQEKNWDKQVATRKPGEKRKIEIDDVGEAFDVDQSGIPAYVYGSKEHLKGKMRMAAKAGRRRPTGTPTAEGKAADADAGYVVDGPREFSSGIHTMQDYYAHSNFCEIGVNLLLKEGIEVAKAPPDKGHAPNCPEHDPKGCGNSEHNHSNAHDPEACADPGHGHNHDENNAKHDAATCPAPGHAHAKQEQAVTLEKLKIGEKGVKGLDTQIHAAGSKENLTVGKGGDQREVLTTGSFNLTDTVASVLEELADKLKGMNPFESKGPSETVMAALDYIDMKEGGDGSGFGDFGEKHGPKIKAARDIIGKATGVAAGAVDNAGDAAASAVKQGTSWGVDALGVLNKANAALGGDADYFDAEKRALAGAGSSAAKSLDDVGADAKKLAASIDAQLAAAEQFLTQPKSLRQIYLWVNEATSLKNLAKQARANIPVVGDELADALTYLDEEIKRDLEAYLGKKWNAIIDKALEVLNEAIAKVREETNLAKKKQQKGGIEETMGGVGDMAKDSEIGPTKYDVPSHTEIAKDHDDMEAPVEDSEKPIDELPGEVAKGVGGEKKKKDGGGEEGHKHSHADHIANWLAPLASKLAEASSKAIGDKVAAAWNAQAAGTLTEKDLAAIDAEVDVWLAHPADNRETWQTLVAAELRKPRIGYEVYKRAGKCPHPTH